MDAPTPALTGPSPYRTAFAGLLVMAAIMGVGRFVYTLILPHMMHDLGLTAAETGAIASSNFVGYLAGAMVAGGPWGEGRERPVIFAVLVANAVLLAAMATTAALPVLIVIRFLAGVVSALGIVFITTIVGRALAAEGRLPLQRVQFMGVGSGIAFSSAVIALLLPLAVGWRQLWLLSAVIAIVAAIVALALLPVPPRGLPRPAAEPPLPPSAPLRALLAAYGLFGLGYSVTATFLVAIVRAADAGPLAEPGIWFLTGLCAALSIGAAARVERRIGSIDAYALGTLAQAAGVVASVALPVPYGPVIGAILVGGTFVSLTSLSLGVVRPLAGQSPRRVFAVMTACFGLGQIIGPLVAGPLADATGSYLLPSLFASSTLVLSFALVLWAKKAI